MFIDLPISTKNRWVVLMLVLVPFSSSCERQTADANLRNGNLPSASPSAQTRTARQVWEDIFYPEIDQLATDAGLENLRTKQPSQHSLEIRIWVERHQGSTRAFVLRRTEDQWSAAFLPPRNSSKSGGRLIPLSAPKSGWTVLWEKLNREDILTLPDAHEVGADNVDPDALAIVVEIKSNGSYRAYNYNGFDTSDHVEAKKVNSFCKTISKEFSVVLC
ncbi:MAG TPA: hypothetical protein VJR02_10945 [Pyrinomonadaceae bacterium]|nr:hypothetical protein [Pyrinomonadaceae bacterium]